MITIGNIQLNEEKETLFVTLYAKSLDYRSKRSLLHDKTADDIIKSIDFDFSKFSEMSNMTHIRARQFDDWIAAFIQEETKGVIVYLGCGLDTRVYRIDPPSSFTWFDVDYPEVIELRKTLLPSRPSYQMVGSSILEEDWLGHIPNDQPTLIVAEGVLEYLDVEEIKALFAHLTDHFQHGVLMFDMMSTFGVASGKEQLEQTTGAVHKWAVDHIEEVDALNDRLSREAYISVFQAPCIKELSIGTRLFCRIALMIPRFRNILRLASYRF